MCGECPSHAVLVGSWPQLTMVVGRMAKLLFTFIAHAAAFSAVPGPADDVCSDSFVLAKERFPEMVQ